MGVAAPSPFLLTLRGPLSSLSGKGAPKGRAGLERGWGGASPAPIPLPPPQGRGALWAAPSRPLWALCRLPASGLGEGSRGISGRGPSLSPTSPGRGRGPAAPLRVGYVFRQAPARQASG